MSRTLGTFFLLIALANGAWGLCFPSCGNSTGTANEGSRVPNPIDCTEFYVCSDANGDGVLELSDEPLTCPEGTYFEPLSTLCQPIPTDGTPYCSVCNPCEIVCTEPGVLIPDPYDCSLYFVCLNEGDFISAACGSGENFDFVQGECLPTDEARCFDSCDVCEIYCVEEGRIPNPLDCHSYLYCEPGVGTAQFDCPDDTYYDPASQECENEGDSPCQNVCGSSGSSTPTVPSGNSTAGGSSVSGIPPTTTTTAAPQV